MSEAANCGFQVVGVAFISEQFDAYNISSLGLQRLIAMYHSIPRADEKSIFEAMIPRLGEGLKQVAIVARFGQVSFSLIKPNGRGFLTVNDRRSSFTLICDDDGTSLGPKQFSGSQMRTRIALADHAYLLAWDYDPLLYSAACLAASVLRQNVVFVETRLAHEADWISFIETINPNIRFTIATPVGGHA